MAVSALAAMLRRLLNPEARTRSARSVEYFGWLELGLGCTIMVGPNLVASLLQLPAVSALNAGYLRIVGVLVIALGMLYIVSGRLNAEGFVVASLLDRPLVPVIMFVLWANGILPAQVAVAFSISDFASFLWTALAWRADVLHGQNIGGPRAGGQNSARPAAEALGGRGG